MRPKLGLLATRRALNEKMTVLDDPTFPPIHRATAHGLDEQPHELLVRVAERLRSEARAALALGRPLDDIFAHVTTVPLLGGDYACPRVELRSRKEAVDEERRTLRAMSKSTRRSSMCDEQRQYLLDEVRRRRELPQGKRIRRSPQPGSIWVRVVPVGGPDEVLLFPV